MQVTEYKMHETEDETTFVIDDLVSTRRSEYPSIGINGVAQLS